MREEDVPPHQVQKLVEKMDGQPTQTKTVIYAELTAGVNHLQRKRTRKRNPRHHRLAAGPTKKKEDTEGI